MRKSSVIEFTNDGIEGERINNKCAIRLEFKIFHTNLFSYNIKDKIGKERKWLASLQVRIITH